MTESGQNGLTDVDIRAARLTAVVYDLGRAFYGLPVCRHVMDPATGTATFGLVPLEESSADSPTFQVVIDLDLAGRVEFSDTPEEPIELIFSRGKIDTVVLATMRKLTERVYAFTQARR